MPGLRCLIWSSNVNTALVHTRGVALTLAVINLEGAYLEWLSVGNVEGLLLHSSNGADIQRKAILMRGGVVGYHLPDLKVERLPLVDAIYWCWQQTA
jgi:hypothetical protein